MSGRVFGLRGVREPVTEICSFARRCVPVAAVVLAAFLIAVPQTPAARGQVSGLGSGILEVDGTFEENLTLPLGGNYYLTVAPYGASTFVNASVVYNGTVLAQDNRSQSASTPVSLPAGNYTIFLRGRGRAALGWDFTNGSQTTFPDNESLLAFLAPQGPRIHVDVGLGDAQSLKMRLYDDALVPAGNATVNASGGVDFLLPASRASIAYLYVTVIAGNPSGLYGLAWTSGPLNPPIDFTAWPWFLLWILVPVAIAAVVLVVLHRRRGRTGLAP